MSLIIGNALAVVIGLSLGLLGGGGSILGLPVLVYILDFPVKQAIPMSLVMVGATSLAGALTHWRAGTVRWRSVLSFGPPAMISAFAVGRASVQVSSRLQLLVFGTVMVVAALSMYFGPNLWGGSRVPAESREHRQPSMLWTVVSGVLVGALVGLIGIGGGFLYVPALVLAGGLAMREAVGTSLILIVASSISALTSHLQQATVDWPATAIFTALAIIGALIGGRLAQRVDHRTLRRAFAVLLVIMGIAVLSRPA